MRILLFLLIPVLLQSCRQEGKKYYIIINIEKEKIKEGYPRSYSLIDSAFFKHDTAAAWEGVKRRSLAIEKNKASGYLEGTYDLKILDENRQDVLKRLTDSFKDRLWSYVPENN